MAIGDSKTVGLPCCAAKNGYRDELVAGIRNHDPTNNVEFSGVLAASEKTTAQTLADLPAFIAAQTQAPDWVLINLGTNDLSAIRLGTVTEAGWKADMGAILDAINAEWPSAKVRLMRPIWIGYEVEAASLNDVWMPSVLSTRSDWAAVGPDERDYMTGFMPDNIHANSAGYTLTAAEWQTAMGY